MYYYLLEQSPRLTTTRFRDQLIDQLTDIGIAGEMVTQSSLKTIDDLLDIGIRKGYTTIVAVGSDSHIHRVVSALMRRNAADRPVLGTIPLNPQSLVGQMLDITHLKAALQALKSRRLAYANLAEIEPGKYILSQAEIHTNRPVPVSLSVDDALIEMLASDITLTGDGHVVIQNRFANASLAKRTVLWFLGVTPTNQTRSVFHGSRIRLATPSPLPIRVDNETLAQTPVSLKAIRRALKIVVARATL